MGFLASTLASLVVAILKWGAERKDFHDAVARQMELQGATLALAAYKWEVAAASRSDGGAGLLSNNTSSIVVTSNDPNPTIPTTNDKLPN